MKFQPYKVAWQKHEKPVEKKLIPIEPPATIPPPIESIKTIPIIPKVAVVPTLETKEVIEVKEPMELPSKETVQETVLEDEAIQSQNFFKPKTFKDYIIVTLIVIIFLLFLWNINSMNELKRLYQTQDKILEILLEKLLKE